MNEDIYEAIDRAVRRGEISEEEARLAYDSEVSIREEKMRENN